MAHNRHHGGTLVEIMISLFLAGVMAMLLIPKFLNTDSKVQNIVFRTEAIMQLVASSIDLYESSTGEEADPTVITYDLIFYDYGNYFAYKKVDEDLNPGPPPNDFYVKYYLLANGTRLAFGYLNEAGSATGHELFTVGIDGNPLDTLPEYDLDSSDTNPEPIVDSEQWNASNAADTFCGDFNPEECFYIDLNGSKAPNKIGPQGDIIPFRINPSNNSIKTLYVWEREQGLNEAGGVCQFLSVYDVESGEDPGTCPISQDTWEGDYLCPSGTNCT